MISDFGGAEPISVGNYIILRTLKRVRVSVLKNIAVMTY